MTDPRPSIAELQRIEREQMTSALRRTNADLAFEASVAPLAISQHLGHATAAPAQVTTRSYAGRGAADEAKAERASRKLQLVP